MEINYGIDLLNRIAQSTDGMLSIPTIFGALSRFVFNVLHNNWENVSIFLKNY